jgi:ABC-type branched-subunit amino acid transport system substrate-binding protein
MKARKVIIFALLAILLLSTLACGGGEEEEERVTEIRFGLGLPLSGLFGAAVGIPSKQAFELTADRIGVFDVGGKQYQWKVIIEDNLGGSAEGGLATTTKFIYEDGVDFILQSGGAAALASQPLCEGSGVILDMGTAQFEAFGPEHPYTMQSGHCIPELVAPFYDWLAEVHPEVKRIVVAAADDPQVAAYNEAFESNMHEYFGFEQDIVWFPQGTTEYYPVATNVMMLDPDLVIASPSTQILDIMWDMGYEGLAAGYGAIAAQSFLEQAGWDDVKGMIFFFPEWYGAEEAGVWPEAVAIAKEYEARSGAEMSSFAFWVSIILQTLTGALQQAGTVDDTGRIMEVIHSRTTLDSMVGPVYYGGEDFVGVNCMLMWPVAIWEVVGEREYELVDYYTPEEAEAIAVEAWTATMP